MSNDALTDEERDEFANGWEADVDKANAWWESLREDEKQRVMGWGLTHGMPSVQPWVATGRPRDGESQ